MKCNPHFVLREVYGKNILMPIMRNEVGNEPIHLNDVATVIWKNANNCNSTDELVEVISELYDLSKDSAEQSAVKQFITQLTEMKLIMD